MVPRSGNAPPLPDASTGHTGGTPTVGPADGAGRRRAVPDEQGRRAPAGGEPRADRPERPADWLRQAGRLPHTDPALPVVNRRGGTPPAAERRPAPAADVDLTGGSTGPLAVPDPAAQRAAGRRPAGPPPDPGANAPTGRRAARPTKPESTGEQPSAGPTYPPAAGERPTGRRGAPANTPDPSGRRRRPPAEPGNDGPAGPGRPGAAGSRGDDPYAGPASGGRP
ncbi:hypothetical protein EAD89_00730, partial [Micromonospora sp. BL4]